MRRWCQPKRPLGPFKFWPSGTFDRATASCDSKNTRDRSIQMIDNAPFYTEKFGEITIEGYSRAAVQTYWRIPELKIGFDLGAQPWDFMGTARWAITHSHLDHIAALPVYIARRRMMKMPPPTIYLPEGAVDAAEAMLRTVARLDRGRLPAEIIPVAPGDEIELSRELAMTVHKTVHTVPSVGYVLWERRTKLKPEFVGLSGPEIRDLRLSGTEVSAETRVPIFAFTGDTSPKGLELNPEFLKAQTLVTEMTFVAPQHRKEKIHKHGHMHLDDFVFNQDWFENEHVIASHFSVRYSDTQIRKLVEKRIPDLWDGRLKLWCD